MKFFLAIAFGLLFLFPAVSGAKEDCTPSGGWACDPGTPEPKPYCPWGHTCPWRFVMNSSGDLVIYQDKTPIALLPKADVRWHPAFLKALSETGAYKTNAIEIVMTKEPAMKISPKSAYKSVGNK